MDLCKVCLRPLPLDFDLIEIYGPELHITYKEYKECTLCGTPQVSKEHNIQGWVVIGVEN